MSGDNSQKEAATTTASSACNADESLTETTMTKPVLACPADNCSKKLKTKQNLGRHMDKFHAVGQQVSNTVRNFLHSPIPGPSSAPDFPFTPSAHAPSAPSADATPATTPAQVPKPRQLFSPGTEFQLQDQEEIFEAEDLFDEINLLTQKVVAPDEEEKNKKDIKEKLERYKNIMVKKDKIIKEATEVNKTLKLSIVTIKHDNAMMSEIQENDKITIEENNKDMEI